MGSLLKYSPPPSHQACSEEDVDSDGIVVIVSFLNGVSESEYYSKPHAKIDGAEVETLLQANAQGKEWKQIPRGHSMYSSKGQRWMLGEISMSSTLADFDEVREVDFIF